ncbi:MAG: hypothetical protein AMXMBFR46_26400 [Acidimicrobiia bacterium]
MSETFSGPIDYLAVEFPGASVTGEGFELIDGLIRNGTIRVLDLDFVLKDTDGYVRSVALGDVDNAGSIDIERWDGASSGLLDQSDIDKVGAAIDPGSLAGILVYEKRVGGAAGDGHMPAGGHVPAGQPPVAPAPAPVPATTSQPGATVDDVLDQPARLGGLRDSGVLTDAEFETQKARILNG